jgi:hypothetical protein
LALALSEAADGRRTLMDDGWLEHALLIFVPAIS